VAAGYLRILATRYLSGIKHPKKLEYAMISSYNGGAGNLWRSLDKNGNKTKSLARINNMTVSEFYWFLTNRHIRGETRNYLKKVSGKQKKYLHL
jgi:membrane-bound lytic murein transglycosylase C